MASSSSLSTTSSSTLSTTSTTAGSDDTSSPIAKRTRYTTAPPIERPKRGAPPVMVEKNPPSFKSYNSSTSKYPMRTGAKARRRELTMSSKSVSPSRRAKNDQEEFDVAKPRKQVARKGTNVKETCASLAKLAIMSEIKFEVEPFFPKISLFPCQLKNDSDSSDEEDESENKDTDDDLGSEFVYVLEKGNVNRMPIYYSGDEDYEVERILVAKKVESSNYFLIKWHNYGLHELTWQITEDLHSCGKVLKNFIDRKILCNKIFSTLSDKERYPGFSDTYVNGDFTPVLAEQNVFENQLMSFYSKNHLGPLIVENWTRMLDTVPDIVMLIRNVYSKSAKHEKLKYERQNKPKKCQCTDCSSRDCNCLQNKLTSRGQLRADMFGHIQECHETCSCTKCPSHTFRRGRRFPLMLFKTSKCGWSVRTLEKIPSRCFVVEYIGMIKLYEECDSISDQTYLFNLDSKEDEPKYVIDATKYCNESRFINHHCEPNLDAIPSVGYYTDPSLPRILFFSNRDIEAGEELTFNYFAHPINEDALPTNPCRCFCGAESCRKYLF